MSKAPALQRLKRAHAAVLGIGGVGSWVVESLARSGIGGSAPEHDATEHMTRARSNLHPVSCPRLTLVDLDEICISNTNRQLSALHRLQLDQS